MQKSLKSAEYTRLIAMLVAVRKDADVRQQALAKLLGRPQSFVAKYEGGERRIDLVEFVAIDLTGLFWTKLCEKVSLERSFGHAEEEVQCGADRGAATPD